MPRPDGSQAFPLSVRIQYSDDLTDLFRTFGDTFGKVYHFYIMFLSNWLLNSLLSFHNLNCLHANFKI